MRSIRQSTLLFALCGILMGGAGGAGAQEAANNYNISHADHLPTGYVDLITNYAAVNQKMRQDITLGKAAMWRSWLDAGLQNNDSLYWWMLADWLYQQKHYDQSYTIAVQAYVFTKMDLSLCSNERESQSTLQRLMSYNKHIIDLKPSQTVIRQSVLNSISRAERMGREGKLVNGMSCYISKIEAIKPGAKKGVEIENLNSPSNNKRKNRMLETQQKIVEDMKKEFAYNKIWINSQANDVWNSEIKQ